MRVPYDCTEHSTTLSARAPQALGDPYCQLMYISTCVSVCLFVGNFDAKYLGNKAIYRGSCP